MFFFAAAAAKETRQTTGVSGVPFSPPSAAAKRKERPIADFIYDTSNEEGLFLGNFARITSSRPDHPSAPVSCSEDTFLVVERS